MKKVLFIGNGAREHSMVENLARDSEVYTVGKARNPGIMKLSKDYVVVESFDDFDALKAFVEKNKPDFAVIGSEEPLSLGVVDFLETLGMKSFGPVKELAKLETSKEWTRMLMVKYGVPGCPKHKTFKSMDGIKEYIEELNNENGFVVKPDGLTGGKGVKVSGEHMDTIEDGVEYCKEVLNDHPSVVIEDKLVGEEFSLMGITDGVTVWESPPIQDHKRAFNGDTGPNTGGMGSYTTGKLLQFMKQVDLDQAHEITEKMAQAIYKETGKKYVGVMYGGFIVTKDGVKLIEYNARFGDPEAMNILPIMKTNFSKVAEACINGTLKNVPVEYEDVATVCRYVVPKGYPDTGEGSGEELDMSGVDDSNVVVHYASIDEQDGKFITSKSRSVSFTGIDKDVEKAQQYSLEACQAVKGPVRFRTDISTKDLLQRRIDHMKSLGRKFD